MSDPAPAQRAPFAALLASALLVVALAGGYAIYVRSSTPAPRSAAGDLLLEDRFDVPAGGGVSRRLRVKAASTIEFRIDPPAGTALEASFGVPGPAEASPVDAPDPAAAVSWTAKAGDAPHRQVVLAPGLYVLRLASASAASPGATSLSLRALPPR